MNVSPRVAVFSEVQRWHEGRLQTALAAAGAQVRLCSLTACRLGAGPHPSGIQLPGFEDALPDAVFVRAIPAGSFEQVTFRLAVLHALRDSGVGVYNDARAIERTVDKGMTSFLLQQAGVATPPAWVCESEDDARAVVAAEAAAGREVVCKPLFGSQGAGLRLLAGVADLPAPDQVAGLYYLQRFIPASSTRAQDLRVMVVGERALAAMRREGQSWVTNRARGGACFATPLTPELAATAVAAVARRRCRLCRCGSHRGSGRSFAGPGSERYSGLARPAVGNGPGRCAHTCRASAAPGCGAHRSSRTSSTLSTAASRMPARLNWVGQAVWQACMEELDAAKPGNVSRTAPGHGMVWQDFARSAACIAPVLGEAHTTVGEKLLRAVAATRSAVGCNTNLGIVLLLAPLAQAALQRTGPASLRSRLLDVLARLSVADAARAFAAIALAAPAGLASSARHDVHAAPTVSLLQAMREAADRDRIAYQYASGYYDVFATGVLEKHHAQARGLSPEWATLRVFLCFLARFPDTHICRKLGAREAEAVRLRAHDHYMAVRALEGTGDGSTAAGGNAPRVLAELARFDDELKSRGINPGTSADLTVATLLVSRLLDKTL